MEAHTKFLAWVARREAQGLTRTAIAAQLGINPAVISKLERDPHRRVSLKLAVAIEREAGIPAAAWVDAA